MRSLLTFLLALLLHAAPAQDILRVMSYNLLQFPGGGPVHREDTLAKIMQWYPVDLLICAEIQTTTGANRVLTDALNVNGEDRFAMATFLPQQSSPGNPYPLTQALYYDQDKLGFKSRVTLLTSVRDINVFTMYLRDEGAEQGDTTFLTVVGLHLKAGSEDENAEARADEATILMDHLATLPAGRATIVGGDYNVYSGAEAAFIDLLASQGNADLADPLDLGGTSWYGSSHAGVHTQSTRTEAVYEGSGGGMDDRFDILLLNAGLMNTSAPLHLVPGSYRALGNNGTCYNDNITDCSGSPAGILRALYYMSDHLPVTLNLTYNAEVGVEEIGPAAIQVHLQGTQLMVTGANVSGSVSFMDASGRTLGYVRDRFSEQGTLIDLPAAIHGFMIATISTAQGRRTARFVLE